VPHDQMYQCEQKKLFKVSGVKEWRWVEREVSGLPSGRDKGIRCKHCHGEVRVHVKKAENGPADHVEHLRREDSEHCQGGFYFKGEHRRSQFAVG